MNNPLPSETDPLPTCLKADSQAIREHIADLTAVCDQIDASPYDEPAPPGPTGADQRRVEIAAIREFQAKAEGLLRFVLDMGGRLWAEHHAKR